MYFSVIVNTFYCSVIGRSRTRETHFVSPCGELTLKILEELLMVREETKSEHNF